VKGRCVEGMLVCCIFAIAGRNYVMICIINDLLNQAQILQVLGIPLEVARTQVTTLVTQCRVLVGLSLLTCANLL